MNSENNGAVAQGGAHGASGSSIGIDVVNDSATSASTQAQGNFLLMRWRGKFHTPPGWAKARGFDPPERWLHAMCYRGASSGDPGAAHVYAAEDFLYRDTKRLFDR